MTIRLAPEVNEKLGGLALDTRRSKSFLPAEAVGTYVDRELAIIEGNSAQPCGCRGRAGGVT
jgi:predicted transcriptional regulator